jgi:HEPN domain-containing protein
VRTPARPTYLISPPGCLLRLNGAAASDRIGYYEDIHASGEGILVTRAEWRRIAEERVHDTTALLSVRRWSAAYYLAGYAVECGLKACVVVHVRRHADVVFREKKYSEKCWTHDIEELVKLAGLKTERDTEAPVNSALWLNWQVVKDWSEVARYQRKTRDNAEKLYQAVTDSANGVLPWIKSRW